MLLYNYFIEHIKIIISSMTQSKDQILVILKKKKDLPLLQLKKKKRILSIGILALVQAQQKQITDYLHHKSNLRR